MRSAQLFLFQTANNSLLYYIISSPVCGWKTAEIASKLPQKDADDRFLYEILWNDDRKWVETKPIITAISKSCPLIQPHRQWAGPEKHWRLTWTERAGKVIWWPFSSGRFKFWNISKSCSYFLGCTLKWYEMIEICKSHSSSDTRFTKVLWQFWWHLPASITNWWRFKWPAGSALYLLLVPSCEANFIQLTEFNNWVLRFLLIKLTHNWVCVFHDQVKW